MAVEIIEKSPWGSAEPLRKASFEPPSSKLPRLECETLREPFRHVGPVFERLEYVRRSFAELRNPPPFALNAYRELESALAVLDRPVRWSDRKLSKAEIEKKVNSLSAESLFSIYEEVVKRLETLPFYAAPLRQSGAWHFMRTSRMHKCAVPVEYIPAREPDEQGERNLMTYNWAQKKIISELCPPDKREVLSHVAITGELPTFFYAIHHELEHNKQYCHGGAGPGFFARRANFLRRGSLAAVVLGGACALWYARYSLSMKLMFAPHVAWLGYAVNLWGKAAVEKVFGREHSRQLLVELGAYEACYTLAASPIDPSWLKEEVTEMVAKKNTFFQKACATLKENAARGESELPSSKEFAALVDFRYQAVLRSLAHAFDDIHALCLLGVESDYLAKIIGAGRLDREGAFFELHEALSTRRVALGLQDDCVYHSTMAVLEQTRIFRTHMAKSSAVLIAREALGLYGNGSPQRSTRESKRANSSVSLGRG